MTKPVSWRETGFHERRSDPMGPGRFSAGSQAQRGLVQSVVLGTGGGRS